MPSAMETRFDPSTEAPRATSGRGPLRPIRASLAGMTLALAGLAGSLVGGCAPTSAAEAANSAPSRRPLPVTTLELGEPKEHTTRRSFTGVLEARREVAVGVQVSGQVLEVAVDTGQSVAAGDLLLRLDDRRLQNAKRTLEAQIAAAEADLKRLQDGPRTETIDAAQAQVQALEEELRLARLRADRREALLARNGTSEEDVDVARSRVKTLSAQLDGARATWQELVNGTRAEVILAAEASLEGLRSQIQSIEIDLADTRLTAPFAGRVQRIMAREGAVLPPGQGVIELVEGILEVKVGLPFAESQLLQNDQAAGPELALERLELMAHGQPLRITGMRSLPRLDARFRTIPWIFEVDAPSPLRPGSPVDLHITETLDRAGWRIPLSAITEGVRGMWSGYVIEDPSGEAIVRTVDLEVLQTEPDAVIVTGALRAGDRLVSEGLDRVVPGQQVDWQGSGTTSGAGSASSEQ